MRKVRGVCARKAFPVRIVVGAITDPTRDRAADLPHSTQVKSRAGRSGVHLCSSGRNTCHIGFSEGAEATGHRVVDNGDGVRAAKAEAVHDKRASVALAAYEQLVARGASDSEDACLVQVTRGLQAGPGCSLCAIAHPVAADFCCLGHFPSDLGHALTCAPQRHRAQALEARWVWCDVLRAEDVTATSWAFERQQHDFVDAGFQAQAAQNHGLFCYGLIGPDATEVEVGIVDAPNPQEVRTCDIVLRVRAGH
mmetsp:Transcript_58904/g.149236  ORF Transcript_58904/g.149236 Transcript_58904/m.149236 type:complete len:252 (-) Transcript_58904:1899-2654(-)